MLTVKAGHMFHCSTGQVLYRNLRYGRGVVTDERLSAERAVE